MFVVFYSVNLRFLRENRHFMQTYKLGAIYKLGLTPVLDFHILITITILFYNTRFSYLLLLQSCYLLFDTNIRITSITESRQVELFNSYSTSSFRRFNVVFSPSRVSVASLVHHKIHPTGS